MENRDYIIILYDFYGELFNEKQREYFEDYYFNNLSLAEIGNNYNVSRNAVNKVIHGVVDKLNFYEEKLGLYRKNKIICDIINKEQDDDIKMKLKELI